MMIDWTKELLGQFDFYWQTMLGPRIEGLTAAEYLWEPVAGCWSVRLGAGGRMTLDWSNPAPDPPPFTTIAWRMGHLATNLHVRAANQFGPGTASWDAVDLPGDVDDACAFLRQGAASWRAGLAALGTDDLARPIGPTEARPFRKQPLASLVLHVNREVFHHGGEIALLRDLYRASAAGTSFQASTALYFRKRNEGRDEERTGR